MTTIKCDYNSNSVKESISIKTQYPNVTGLHDVHEGFSITTTTKLLSWLNCAWGSLGDSFTKTTKANNNHNKSQKTWPDYVRCSIPPIHPPCSRGLALLALHQLWQGWKCMSRDAKSGDFGEPVRAIFPPICASCWPNRGFYADFRHLC